MVLFVLLAIATVPVTLLVPVLADKVPPFKVIGSATPVTLRKSRVPPVLTVVLPVVVPKAEALVTTRVPALTMMFPVEVFTPERI